MTDIEALSEMIKTYKNLPVMEEKVRAMRHAKALMQNATSCRVRLEMMRRESEKVKDAIAVSLVDSFLEFLSIVEDVEDTDE